MERYKENLKSRQEQNIASFVLMICFLILTLSFWGAVSLMQSENVAVEESPEILASQGR